jgi:hypothetical protein
MNAKLASLLTAAAALGTPLQATADDATRMSYRYSDYDEDSLSATPLDGSDRRYHIRTQQLDVVTPLGEGGTLKVGLTSEIMSGSSPWFLFPDEDGRAQQIMSGATIRESRQQVDVGWDRDAGGGNGYGFSATYSDEDDYRSGAIGGERRQALNEAWTLGYGASYSHDTIHPSDPIEFQRVTREQKNTGSLFVSLAQVLDRSSVLQYGLSLTQSSGFLSDPYKRFYAGGRFLNDSRPDERTQGALLLRYRRAFEKADAALHADYRYAQDSWGVHSHTIDLAWYQSLGDDWKLVPSLRWYSQDPARFHALYSTSRTPGPYYSSDYRLGGYGALSAGVDLRKRFGRFEWVLGISRYHSSTDYALGDTTHDDPGLVSFTQAHLGLDLRFE